MGLVKDYLINQALSVSQLHWTYGNYEPRDSVAPLNGRQVPMFLSIVRRCDATQ
jgi:hypothetical protein